MAHIESTKLELSSLLSVFDALYKADSNVAYQNPCNSLITVSRHSSSLISNYHTENPLVQLILTAIERHMSVYKDGGCSLGTMICHLILQFYNSEYHPKLYTGILSWCSQQCVSLLSTLSNQKLEINAKSIRSVIHDTLSSKVLTYMELSALDLMVTHLAEIFILSGGKMTSNTIDYIRTEDVKHNVLLYTGIILDRYHSVVTLPAGCYKTVFVTCSMTGDTDELHKAVYTGQSSQPITQAVMNRMSHIVKELSAQNVTLLVCQKVIHPEIKLLLRSHRISYLERLGLKMQRLLYMTDSVPYESVVEKSVKVSSVELSVSHTTFNNDIHLLLSCKGDNYQPTFTLVIQSWSEHVASDIQKSCGQALDVLRVLLNDPRQLSGGGQWQDEMIPQLLKAAGQVSSPDLQRLGCNISSFRDMVQIFSKCLTKSSVNAGEVYESWRKDCLLTQQSMISTAVAISNLVILTSNVIRVL
ncbi:MKKS [Bugula neritina]|uniref:MKKS n=1 Tax=Bugula neritina TaxID=10212 RepID=A0A7J7JTI1_BUGNE|nr:MKKS [Bugula neritina]